MPDQEHYGRWGLTGVSGFDGTARPGSLVRRAATLQEPDIQVDTPKWGNTHFMSTT
jgi:hypothetical protein